MEQEEETVLTKKQEMGSDRKEKKHVLEMSF